MNTKQFEGHTLGPLEVSKHATPDYAPQYGIYAADGTRIAIVTGKNAEADAHGMAKFPTLLGIVNLLRIERKELLAQRDALLSACKAADQRIMELSPTGYVAPELWDIRNAIALCEETTDKPAGLLAGAGIPKGERVNTYTKCGCCEAYHRTDFHGDCREDAERFAEVPTNGIEVEDTTHA